MNKKIRFFQSIHFKIAVIFVLLLLVALEIIGAYFIRQLEEQMVSNFKGEVHDRVVLLEYNLKTTLASTDEKDKQAQIQGLLTDFSGSNIIEAQAVDSDGKVVGTSDISNQHQVGQKTTDTEIKQALFGSQREQTYTDKTTNKRVWRLVSPIFSDDGNTVGAIYLKTNIESVYTQINNITVIFFTGSAIAALLTIILALLVSRTITKPISEMKKQAIRIADGDFSGEVKIYGQDELGQLAVAINDLSTRVEEGQESTEAERRRLDSVLAHMTDGVLATDRRGSVIIINETGCELLSTTMEEAIGKSILELLDIEAEYSFRQLLETENELTLDFSTPMEELILRADFSLIQRETGFISGTVCVLHDITEQEKTEREQREFVSNVSHELRTPLTSMRSYLEALSDGAWKDPDIAPQFLEVTQDETERMIRLINDLLNLSRMDAGKSKMELEFVNLNELLGHVLNRFDMMLQNNEETEKRYRIEREFTKRDIWVEIDADKVIQVLDNIMNNAVKYSPDGGVISCRLEETHHSVIISISDQGLGVPKKDVPHIFDRFFRVDKARARSMGGTGLGLAISKEVILAHKGKIWLESIEGKGSTFYISLPYEPYEEVEWE